MSTLTIPIHSQPPFGKDWWKFLKPNQDTSKDARIRKRWGGYEIELSMPGVTPDDLTIYFREHTLHITARIDPRQAALYASTGCGTTRILQKRIDLRGNLLEDSTRFELRNEVLWIFVPTVSPAFPFFQKRK